MPLQPFQKITMQRLSGSAPQTPEARRTLPVNVFGRNFSVQLYDSATIQTSLVLQANNSNYIDPSVAGHTLHPVGSFFDNTKYEALNSIIGPGPEVATKDPDFDNHWVTIHSFTGGDLTEITAVRDSYRFIRLLFTDANALLDMNTTLVGNVSIKN